MSRRRGLGRAHWRVVIDGTVYMFSNLSHAVPVLRELNLQDDLTVVVTLHQIDYARQFCDRIVALNKGQVLYDGPQQDLTKEKLIEIYGPEFEAAFYGGEEA